MSRTTEGSNTGKYEDIFQQAADKYDLDINLLKAVAYTESSLDANATSDAGAMGIMQLMPATAEGLGVTNAYDPYQNIMGGAKYLSQLLDQTNGDVTTALAGYNAGMGNVRKYGAQKYSGYTSKVLDNYESVSGGETLTGEPSESVEVTTKWWGDIVVVVFTIIVILIGVLFLFGAFGNSFIPTAKNIKKKAVEKLGGLNK